MSFFPFSPVDWSGDFMHTRQVSSIGSYPSLLVLSLHIKLKRDWEQELQRNGEQAVPVSVRCMSYLVSVRCMNYVVTAAAALGDSCFVWLSFPLLQ